jgi:hypothetical protein
MKPASVESQQPLLTGSCTGLRRIPIDRKSKGYCKLVLPHHPVEDGKLSASQGTWHGELEEEDRYTRVKEMSSWKEGELPQS